MWLDERLKKNVSERLKTAGMSRLAKASARMDRQEESGRRKKKVTHSLAHVKLYAPGKMDGSNGVSLRMCRYFSKGIRFGATDCLEITIFFLPKSSTQRFTSIQWAASHSFHTRVIIFIFVFLVNAGLVKTMIAKDQTTK